MIKCGTDIVDINRIKDSIDRYGEKFINKVFTEKEIEYCESKKNQKYQHYAARFAAKEAAFKALSENIIGNAEWKSFEILNSKEGKPIVNLYIEIENLNSIDISLSHEKDYAIAYVVVVV